MKRGLVRCWYRLKNWFRIKPVPGAPPTFLRGSEEELRRVTTWTCHIHPQIFQEDEQIVVCYTAPFLDQPPRSGSYLCKNSNLSTMSQRHLEVWAALIMKHNDFIGTERVMEYVPREKRLEFVPHPRMFSEVPVTLCVMVHSPSMHEQAEALLSLSEWLDGKVSEQEKRELLQLPDDVEV